jgi:hypothetical protein
VNWTMLNTPAKCTSVLGWTALGVKTGQQQHRDKDECSRH